MMMSKQLRWKKKELVTCINESVDLIESKAVWDLPYTGNGIRVAVLDSGIDSTHPNLNVVHEYNATDEQTSGDGIVPGNHGTHVAGIIASQDPVLRGMAFGADLINIKVLTSEGEGIPEWVVEGLQEAMNATFFC